MRAFSNKLSCFCIYEKANNPKDYIEKEKNL